MSFGEVCLGNQIFHCTIQGGNANRGRVDQAQIMIEARIARPSPGSDGTVIDRNGKGPGFGSTGIGPESSAENITPVGLQSRENIDVTNFFYPLDFQTGVLADFFHNVVKDPAQLSGIRVFAKV